MKLIKKLFWYSLTIIITTFIVGGLVFLWVRLLSLQDQYTEINRLNNYYQKELEKKDQNINQLLLDMEELKANNPLGYLPPKEINSSTKSIKGQVRLQQNPDNKDLTDVYTTITEVKDEKLFISLTNVALKHDHNAEFYNDHLYIIRFNAKTNKEELWQYDAFKKGIKIFEDKQIDFRVAPFENYVAILSENRILMLNDQGLAKTFNHFQLGIFNKSFTVPYKVIPLKWSEDGSVFWGQVQEALEIRSFFSINTQTWEISKYDLSKQLTQLAAGETTVNPEKLLLAYSDLPIFYDPQTEANFYRGSREVKLYIYDFKTGNQQQISQSKAKNFQAQWLNSTTLEYKNPNGTDKLQYIVK